MQQHKICSTVYIRKIQNLEHSMGEQSSCYNVIEDHQIIEMGHYGSEDH